jgi:hypothetical protein
MLGLDYSMRPPRGYGSTPDGFDKTPHSPSTPEDMSLIKQALLAAKDHLEVAIALVDAADQGSLTALGGQGKVLED